MPYSTSCILVGALLLVAAASPPVAAAQAETSPESPAASAPIDSTASLEQLLHEALAANPEIAQARALWRAQQERVPAAGALADPVLGLGLDDQPFEGGLKGKRVISLSQSLPFPGKRSPLTGAAQAETEVAREQALEIARRVVTDVKVTYLELFMFERQLAALRDSDGALRDVVDVTRTRYETGVAGEQDLLLARVERATLGGEVRRLQAEAVGARGKLSLLLNRDAEIPLRPIRVDGLSAFTDSLPQLQERARHSRALLRASERAVEAARVTEQAAQVSARPDLMLSAGYMQIPNFEDMWQAELGITLPIWKGRKQSASAAEAGARTVAASHQLHAQRNLVAAEVQQRFATLVAARQIEALYRTDILPQAELAYASAKANYLTGQLTFLVLLESLRKLIELRGAYFRFLADAEIQLAQLESAVGADLGAIHLDLEQALEAPDPPASSTGEAGDGQPAPHGETP